MRDALPAFLLNLQKRCATILSWSAFPSVFLVDFHDSDQISTLQFKNRNCAECSTEFTPMIEFCAQGSIKDKPWWLILLPEWKMLNKRWKSILHLLHEK